MNTEAKETQAQLQQLYYGIDDIRNLIRDLVNERIPEYHFLTHKVSNFWKCDASPIGWCVWHIDDGGFVQSCNYCHEPTERK